MEDTRQWFTCEECSGEFAVETDCSMKIEWCVFCGEPLDEVNWEYDDANIERESEG